MATNKKRKRRSPKRNPELNKPIDVTAQIKAAQKEASHSASYVYSKKERGKKMLVRVIALAMAALLFLGFVVSAAFSLY